MSKYHLIENTIFW